MRTFEETYTAWIDGKLSPEEASEFERTLQDRDLATRDRVEAQQLGQMLRARSIAPQMGNEEFFNHQLMERIEAEVVRPEPAGRRFGFNWTIPRLAWAGAACLAAAAALFTTLVPRTEDKPYLAQVVAVRAGDPSLQVNAVWERDENLTVVWIDGLPDLPATYTLE